MKHHYTIRNQMSSNKKYNAESEKKTQSFLVNRPLLLIIIIITVKILTEKSLLHFHTQTARPIL